MTKPLYLNFLDAPSIARWTDKYFTRTRMAVEKGGECQVIYAVFLRRPCVMACDIALAWLEEVAKAQNFKLDIRPAFKTGMVVGAGEPLFFLEGPFSKLSELENHLLQKIGPVCVAAYNAREMVLQLPHISFIEMGSRHCAGFEMAELMAYAAHAGTQSARMENASTAGFIGTSTDGGARFFENTIGMGTMPHALVGYAGSTLEAAKLYRLSNPEADFTILPDYFGREVTDALAVCRFFEKEAKVGIIKFRLDTHGGRYIEGLDKQASYAVIERNAPRALQNYLSKSDQEHLLGEGVSAAAIWHFREQMDAAGFPQVKIIGSSGFGPEKCRIMKLANAPVDIIGTGSYLPAHWQETYATADIISYDGTFRVKEGREWLVERYKAHIART